MTLPVVCANLPSHCSADETNCADITDGNSCQPYYQHVPLPSYDPWTFYVDRLHNTVVAVGPVSPKARVTQTQAAAKSAVRDKLLCDVPCLRSEASSPPKNYWTNKQISERTAKPLYQVAAECRENGCSEQLSDLKLRLADELGKHWQE